MTICTRFVLLPKIYGIVRSFFVGHKHMKVQLKWLSDLQDALGVWHDRQVLDQAVAAALARAEILLNELQTVRVLLAELETDRSRQLRAVDKIFRLATNHPGHVPLSPNRSPGT